ncbi:MAG: hypothetical protein ACKOC5_04625 [Chloroflexota bacterium]
MKLRILLALLTLPALLTGCRIGPPARTATPGSPPVPTTAVPPPATTAAPSPTFTDTPGPTATFTPQPGLAQPVTFQAEDGVELTGDLFPAPGGPAPAVLLMHQMGSNRQVWVEKGLVAWLTRSAPPADAAGPVWPERSGGPTFPVLIFDFRGHGDSQGQPGEMADFLSDAKAAYTFLSRQPSVDPQRIVLIGASIGADAAVDICVDGCLGALSLSPGGYLDVPYAQVVSELALDNKPAWCIAAQGDPLPYQTCQDAGGASYRFISYPDTAHGADLLQPGRLPEIGQVFLDFLKMLFAF